MGGNVEVNAGYSAVKSFTIGSGADGSSVDPVDLGGRYEIIIIRCEDCSNIQASTTASLQVGNLSGDTLCDLYQRDAPGTLWGNSQNLPTTGTWQAVIVDAYTVRRVRLTLSQNTSGGSAVFKVQGVGRIRDG